MTDLTVARRDYCMIEAICDSVDEDEGEKTSIFRVTHIENNIATVFNGIASRQPCT
jgi:hypothetical protein